MSYLYQNRYEYSLVKNLIISIKVIVFIIKKNKKNKKLIISSGYFSHKAFEITKKNKSFDLLDIYKIRINEKIFLHDIRQYKKVIFYDENTYEGGITPIILRVLLKAKKNFKIYYKLVPSKQIFLYSQSREDLFKN